MDLRGRRPAPATFDLVPGVPVEVPWRHKTPAADSADGRRTDGTVTGTQGYRRRRDLRPTSVFVSFSDPKL